MLSTPIYIVYDPYSNNTRLIGAYTDPLIAEKIAKAYSYKIIIAKLNHIFPGALDDVGTIFGEEIKTMVANNTIIDLETITK